MTAFMSFVEFLKNLKRKFYSNDSLIKVVVFSDNLIHNFRQFKKISKIKVAPVLKSNAYGHGIIEVARILKNEDAPFFCLDSLFEARQIRRAGIRKKILIIGFVRQDEILKSSVSNISFVKNTSSSTIDVSISTQKSLFDQNNTSVVSGTITLRN